MARLASETKMGFYATSTKTIQNIISKMIDIDKNTFVIDSCAGEGEVIEMFREEYQCYNFAVELNQDRAKIAAERNIMKVLNADAINGVRKSTKWAGFNFLNPPYDRGADGERLELKFVERWGNATIEGGVMMLVINPSSADEDMAKKLILQGYKVLWSVFDPDNEDYKNFGQYFILLKRVRENFRADLDEFMIPFTEPMSLDDFEEVEKIRPKRGCPPPMFKEIDIPQWKMNDLLSRSNLKKVFFDDMRKGSFKGGSIEVPNEGQAAILIASGKLNRKITLVNGDEVILKGTVKKHRVDKSVMDENTGMVENVKRIDAYQTVVYGLNLSVGQFVRYE